MNNKTQYERLGKTHRVFNWNVIFLQVAAVILENLLANYQPCFKKFEYCCFNISDN